MVPDAPPELAHPWRVTTNLDRVCASDDIDPAVAALFRRSAPAAKGNLQAKSRSRGDFGPHPGTVTDWPDHRGVGVPGLAYGRRHCADARSDVRDAQKPARMGDGGASEARRGH